MANNYNFEQEKIATEYPLKKSVGVGAPGVGYIDNFLNFPPTAQFITEGKPMRITWQNPWYPACLTPMGKLIAWKSP